MISTLQIIWVMLSIAFSLSCNPEKCCSISDNEGNWIRLASLNMSGRSEAVSINIGDISYVGSGWDGINKRFGDFWKYNSADGSWQQIASLPVGAERSSAIVFSISGFAFFGTGYDGSQYLNDFYKYDPGTNGWTKLNSVFPGQPRSESIAFTLENIGYVGTGFDGNQALADLYSYDPVHDHWTSIPFNGEARYGAVSMVMQNKAYIFTGTNGQNLLPDFWVFNPADLMANWKRLNDISNTSADSYDDAYTTITRSNGVCTIIGNKAYITTVNQNNVVIPYTWEYDFSTDLWIEKTPFEGPPTTGAVGISIGNKGFLLTGMTKDVVTDQFWEFKPDDTVNPDDN